MDKLRENMDDDLYEKIILPKIKNSEPLIPKIDNNANSNYDQNIRKSIEDNLLDRLSIAILKQKQSEQSIDATWSINSDFQENFIIDESLKGVQLPKHVEENIKGISQSAKEYINKLEEQLHDLDIADNQVRLFFVNFIRKYPRNILKLF